jgi:hypothetical protein
MTLSLLQEWAQRWSISPTALADLLQTMGAVSSSRPPHDPSRTSEAYVQSLVRLEAPLHDVWLTRNNVGALVDKTGRPVRYGLANESKTQNKTIKSGDLIGIRRVRITPAHIGTVIGQFVSREIKHAEWTWRGDAHENAQLNWALLVQSYGGDAKFVTGEGSF